MESNNIRLAGIVEESIVDGPGYRYVIFTQGCTHGCFMCHNLESHDLNGGFLKNMDEIINDINQTTFLKGVTFSGGEPFLQPKECAYIAKNIKKEYDIICYTGFLFEELINNKNPDILKFLENIDYLIDGKFIYKEKSLELKYKGSKNQRIIDLKKTFKLNRIIEIEL